MPPTIGTLSEKSLHAALKQALAAPGDQFEVQVDEYVIDIVRGDLLIEIQTGGFSPLKRKIGRLLARGRRVHLIHPIPVKKWIVKETPGGRRISRRKSPKRGRSVDIFNQLVRIPEILPQKGFSLEVVITEQEELRVNDGHGSWRRGGWSIRDHRLLNLCEHIRFHESADYLQFLPDDLERPFTNRDLQKKLAIPDRLAGKMTYTLYKAGWLARVGKRGNAHLYAEKV